jgi:hypothetical protein
MPHNYFTDCSSKDIRNSVDFTAGPHSSSRLSGTWPNVLNTVASPKFPMFGSFLCARCLPRREIV